MVKSKNNCRLFLYFGNIQLPDKFRAILTIAFQKSLLHFFPYYFYSVTVLTSSKKRTKNLLISALATWALEFGSFFGRSLGEDNLLLRFTGHFGASNDPIIRFRDFFDEVGL